MKGDKNMCAKKLSPGRKAEFMLNFDLMSELDELKLKLFKMIDQYANNLKLQISNATYDAVDSIQSRLKCGCVNDDAESVEDDEHALSIDVKLDPGETMKINVSANDERDCDEEDAGKEENHINIFRTVKDIPNYDDEDVCSDNDDSIYVKDSDDVRLEEAPDDVEIDDGDTCFPENEALTKNKDFADWMRWLDGYCKAGEKTDDKPAKTDAVEKRMYTEEEFLSYIKRYANTHISKTPDNATKVLRDLYDRFKDCVYGYDDDEIIEECAQAVADAFIACAMPHHDD